MMGERTQNNQQIQEQKAILKRIHDRTITKAERDSIRKKIENERLNSEKDRSIIETLRGMCDYGSYGIRVDKFKEMLEAKKQEIIEQIFNWYKFQIAYIIITSYYADLMAPYPLDDLYHREFNELLDGTESHINEAIETGHVFNLMYSDNILDIFDEMDQDEAEG